MTEKKQTQKSNTVPTDNSKKNNTIDNGEGNDKAPGEEENKNEPVTIRDLKGKKVDGDPEKESDKPVE